MMTGKGPPRVGYSIVIRMSLLRCASCSMAVGIEPTGNTVSAAYDGNDADDAARAVAFCSPVPTPAPESDDEPHAVISSSAAAQVSFRIMEVPPNCGLYDRVERSAEGTTGIE